MLLYQWYYRVWFMCIWICHWSTITLDFNENSSTISVKYDSLDQLVRNRRFNILMNPRVLPLSFNSTIISINSFIFLCIFSILYTIIRSLTSLQSLPSSSYRIHSLFFSFCRRTSVVKCPVFTTRQEWEDDDPFQEL